MMGGLLKRGDEIGDSARVSEAMTSALWQRITAMERFAADVSCSSKNPLNSIAQRFLKLCRKNTGSGEAAAPDRHYYGG
jgi:hypothetical protein